MANLQALDSSGLLDSYLSKLRTQLSDLDRDDQDHLLAYARAQVELDLEIDHSSAATSESLREVLERLGPPEIYARRLRETALPGERDKVKPETPVQETPAILVTCRACSKQISREAYACPHCGCPFPARLLAPASGYEWKSKTTVFGWPLVHVAFGRNKNGKMRVAKGVIAIGQFGIGAITLAQFGIGFVFGLGQFMIAPIAVGQFAAGLVAAGQFGFGALAGAGQFATGWLKAIGLWTWPHR